MNIPEPATPRILIIDDSAASINVIARALAPEFSCEFALSGQEALARLATGELPDLILLDLRMPEMDGEEVLHRLKSDLHTHDIPVIVITASNDPASELSALLAGAADFIHKPINPQVVRLRVGLHILLKARERTLSRLNQEITDLARYDPLTGLPNRRGLMERLQHPMIPGVCRDDAGALMFIDLEHFKTVNETLGRARGDLLLQQVAQRLMNGVRESDTVARLGGDEFVIVLTNPRWAPAINTAKAKIIGEKVLAALSAPYRLDGLEYHCVANIGILLLDHDQWTVEALLTGADRAMARAKVSSRNGLCFIAPTIPGIDRV